MTASADSDYRALLSSFDPFDPAHEEWKYDAFAYARENCPVVRTEALGGMWIVTRYEDVRRVLGGLGDLFLGERLPGAGPDPARPAGRGSALPHRNWPR